MLRLHVRGPGQFALALCATCVLAALSTAENNPPAAQTPVRIGMINTLFRDTPEGVALAMMQPFGAMMRAQTGVAGHLVPGGDADSLAEKLATNQLQLGVFHGIEYAWARLKHPQLRPLVIAVNQHRQLHAYLVVRGESKVSTLNDLKGKAFALPRQSKEHCHVFVHHGCRQCGDEPCKFFTVVTSPANLEEALDDVVDGVVQATVVDGIGLECYQRRKPGRFAKLKSIQQSEPFPAAVVVYKPGTVEAGKLEQFRTGLLKAGESATGKQLLNLWKLTGFEPVPSNYEANLEAIARSYPSACMGK